MHSRRTLLKMLALGGTLFAAEAGATAEAMTKPGPKMRLPDGPEPWWLIFPLEQGSSLPRSWRVGTLSRVERGASILELVHASGERARVHICFRKGEAMGLAHSEMFDLLLMDGGNGDRSTEEGLARVLQDIARRIRTNELRQDANLRPLARMQTHDERVGAYGPETLT
jgi:hypothetical protein